MREGTVGFIQRVGRRRVPNSQWRAAGAEPRHEASMWMLRTGGKLNTPAMHGNAAVAFESRMCADA